MYRKRLIIDPFESNPDPWVGGSLRQAKLGRGEFWMSG